MFSRERAILARSSRIALKKPLSCFVGNLSHHVLPLDDNFKIYFNVVPYYFSIVIGNCISRSYLLGSYDRTSYRTYWLTKKT